MQTYKKRIMAGIVTMAAIFVASPAYAVKTFTNVSGTDWNTAANWDGALPVAGDDVVINGNVVLTNSTPALNSYTLNASRMHTFDGWNTSLNANTVTISGTMTHTNNLATSTNSLGVWVPNARVRVQCANLSLSLGAQIDITGKGFQGNVFTNGNGPGAGMAKPDRGSGGGYGAQGSSAVGYKSIGGMPYGSATHPDMPGSSGGASLNDVASKGGAGGGLLQIYATGAVAINGNVNADGVNGTVHCPGAGSGGGVFIRCATLSGSGTISAKGGNDYVGGGGGRIAIDITDAPAQALVSPAPTIKFTSASVLGSGDRRYDPGTLHFSSRTFFPYSPLTFGSYVLTIDGATELQMPSLTVTGGEPWLAHGHSINIAGDLTVRNTGTLLFLSEADAYCGGNLIIENGGQMQLLSAPTNGIAPEYGNIVEVAGLLKVAANSSLLVQSNPTNGGSMFFDVWRLEVDAGGIVDASSKGFSGGIYVQKGYGPGGGYIGGDRGGGGGYGGKGATNLTGVNAKGGPTYGLPYMPLLPGSGGGGKSNTIGGSGGGLVRMRVRGDAIVNGTITANGKAVGTFYSPAGDGSGGGVFLDCRSFSGTGTISANGGMTPLTSHGANGGGGRIAVWLNVPDHYRTQYLAGNANSAVVTSEPPDSFTGTLSVASGPLGYEGELAEPGTVAFLVSPPLGSSIMIR